MPSFHLTLVVAPGAECEQESQGACVGKSVANHSVFGVRNDVELMHIIVNVNSLGAYICI